MDPAISVSLPLTDSMSISALSNAVGSPSRSSRDMCEPCLVLREADVADLRMNQVVQSQVQKRSERQSGSRSEGPRNARTLGHEPQQDGSTAKPEVKEALTVPVPPPLRWSGGGEGGCEERRRTEGDADGEQCCARMIPIGDLQTALTVRPTAMVAKAAAPS